MLGSHPDIVQAAVDMREDLPGTSDWSRSLLPGPAALLTRLKHDLKETMPGYIASVRVRRTWSATKNSAWKAGRRALHVALDSRASKLDLTSAYVGSTRRHRRHARSHVGGDPPSERCGST